MKLKKGFIPDRQEWRKVVWERGKDLFEKIILHLSEESVASSFKEN